MQYQNQCNEFIRYKHDKRQLINPCRFERRLINLCWFGVDSKMSYETEKRKVNLCSYILSRKNEQILKYRLLSFNYIKYASKKSHSRFLEWSNLRNRLQIREGKERRKCIMRPRDGLLICLVYPVYTWNNVIQFVKKHIVPPLKFNFKKSSRVLTATYINWYNLRILILTPRCEQDLKIFRFL